MKENYFKLSRELIAILLLAAATVLLIVCLLISGNKKDAPKPKSYVFYEYLDTVCTVYDYSGGEQEDFDKSRALIEEKLSYYHKLFDIYNEYDGIVNLATLNRLAPEEAVEVDREIIELLDFSVSMHELTEGKVNVAMGSVLSIWHRYREEGNSIPTAEELAEANTHTDIAALIIDKGSSTVRFLDPKLRLDVGAIAKGYVTEKCAQLLEKEGYTSYVLDFGGNLRAIGTKPDGTAWRTGVQNPDLYSDTPYVYYLDVKDTSVVTSGDYQRYYIVDGKSYHHIIDPDTLFPADRYSSVTVVYENSAIADAMSTALFNMDMTRARALLDTFDDITVVWVYPSGEVKTYGSEE